jgi:hypothetical protein
VISDVDHDLLNDVLQLAAKLTFEKLAEVRPGQIQ